MTTTATWRIARTFVTTATAALITACGTNPLSLSTATIVTPPITGIPAPIPSTVASKDAKARIALILPLAGMGQQAVIAKGMKQAAELALSEHSNDKIELIVKDDYGSASGARVATQQAMAEGAEIILGPLTAATVPTVSQVAKTKNLPVVAFSNDVSVAGNGVYLLSFLAQQETQRVVTFAASQGKRRFAALIPSTAYGDAVEPAFRAAVAAAGGVVVASERYPLDANTMLDPVQRVLGALPSNTVDALFVPGGDDVLTLMGPQLTYANVNTQAVKLLGTSAWDTAAIARQPAFMGGWYAGADMNKFSGFADRFRKMFGTQPPRLATLSYDAVNMVITMAAEQRAVKFAAPDMTRPGGFMGVDGVVRFAANGLAERGLAINEVTVAGPRVVAPAPGALGPVQVSALAQ
jgi:branched-chain amino acid transport system substrate-binding protein